MVSFSQKSREPDVINRNFTIVTFDRISARVPSYSEIPWTTSGNPPPQLFFNSRIAAEQVTGISGKMQILKPPVPGQDAAA